jgi:stage V sporulation protein D (sporulation-specific penicillin-binding protein)
LKHKNQKKKFSLRNRLFIILIIFTIVLIGFIGRLVYIMIVQGDYLRLKAEKQWTSKTLIQPTRGEILDRNYNKLVTNENDFRIDIDLKTMEKSLETKKMSMSELESKISTILGMKTSDIDTILKSDGNYKILKRWISSDQKDKIEALNINGIIISPDTKRYYVNGDFLSQVLGYTNSENKGVSGVELSYDDVLSGTP